MTELRSLQPGEAAVKCGICSAYYVLNRKGDDQSKCPACKAEAARAALDPTLEEVQKAKQARANEFRGGNVSALLPLPEKASTT